MSSNNRVTIEVEIVEKIIKELKEISILCFEPYLQMKIEILQSFVSTIIDLGSEFSVEDAIYEKMIEVKHVNPDLHLKLYMLYRNLRSGRVSEVDAMTSFDSFSSVFPL